MKKFWSKILGLDYAGLFSFLLDVLGISAVVAGVAMIHVPSGFIVGGVLLLVVNYIEGWSST